MSPGHRSSPQHPSLVARWVFLFGIAWLLAAATAVEGAPVRLPNGFVREGLAGPELQEPMDIAFAPDGSAWITGRAGHLWRLDPQDRSVVQVGRIATDTAGDRGLHGIAFHPDFSAATGGEVFLFHHATNKPSGLYRSRVSRWNVAGAGPAARLVPGSEKILLEFDGEERGQHVGGGLLAHPVERLLYVTTGDNNEIGRLKSYCGDTNNQALNPADLRGKVLRVGFDGGIPPGNPFRDGPGLRGEVYTMGHRQPWALSYDPPTGWLLEAENGGDELDDHEEVNRLEAGANHGWPRVFSDGMETLTRTNRITGYAAPWFHYLRNTGGSCTGALIYRAPRPTGSFPGRFHGGLFYSDYNRKSVRFAAVDPKSGRPGDSESFAQNLPGGPVAMRLGPDGALYLVEYGGWFQSTTNDSISRIVWRP